jgi:predicted DNA-binding transcriptional regulator YafY
MGEVNPVRDAITLLLALQQRGRLTTADAATLLESEKRHARRALGRLAEHAPVHRRGEGRDTEWILDPVAGQARLAIYDRIALRVGRDATSFLEGTPLDETLERAADETHLPPRLAHNLGRKIRVKQEPAWIIDDRHDSLHELLDGLLRERTLRIRYAGHTGDRDYPAFVPLTLVVYRRVLYLLGYPGPALDGKPRRLRIDRIRAVDVGEPFTYPDAWDPDSELDGWFGIEASGEPETIVLEFTEQVAPLVRERTWHPTQHLEPTPDGGVRLVMRTGGRELVRFALEWGRHCRVVAPDWLRRAVIGELRVALESYDAGDRPTPAAR